VELARSRGIPVDHATIEQASLEPGSLDAAIAWHVLEHLEDPATALSRIAMALRNGGKLVVACPNLASLQARIGGDDWFQQDVPRHRNHFTARGLRLLLERSGFRVERLSHLVVEQNPLGMWQTLLNRLTGERDVAFRFLKRDLRFRSRAAAVRDLAVTAILGPVLVPAAILLELGAGCAGRGGSVVLEASLSAPPRGTASGT
jgi:predicted SAM-dependent methyltransferase